MTHYASHTRVVGALAATALLALGLTGVTAPPSDAAPTADCATPYPIDQLQAGAELHGLTVSTGTVPEQFGATAIGVLHDGIAPGLDMVMVKVDPTGLDIDPSEVQGIWQGMSGSPVYAADGRLVGAVAYGLSYQQSWVAGVTPYADMDDYLGAAPQTTSVDVGRATARKVARAAGVTTAQAEQGFTALPMPVAVAGVPARDLAVTKAQVKQHRWLQRNAYAAGKMAAGDSDAADTIVAGGNLAASMSYGDVTIAGVGTATSVCDGEVVGFGHPMSFLGDSTMTLNPADSLYIQGDAPSFKVANIGEPVGTIFGDHLTGITGVFGSLPATATITSSVTAGDHSRTGTSHAAVRSADNLAWTSYYQTSTNHTRVLDKQAPGSELLRWTVTGTDEDGAPFTLDWTDRVLSTYALADDVGYRVGDVAYAVGGFPGVTVDSVSAVSTDVTDSTATFRITGVEQLQKGVWTKVSTGKPAKVAAGQQLKLRVTLDGAGTTVTLPFHFKVPGKAPRGIASVGVYAGDRYGLWLGNSLESAEEAVANAIRSDQVQATFTGQTSKGGSVGRGADGGSGGGGQTKRFKLEQTSKPQSAAVTGHKLVTVRIR